MQIYNIYLIKQLLSLFIFYYICAMATLNVNSSAVIAFTDRLERLNSRAFPSAVRATLSDAAFEMKKSNILESAKRNMKVKAPNFFKANTGVQRAVFSSKIENMKATVGFMNKEGRTADKAVTQGMIANEIGGNDDDGMKYYGKTRTPRGLVKKKQYYDVLKKDIDDDTSGNFVRKMFRAKKNNKLVKTMTKHGQAIFRVKSIKKLKKGKVKINTDLLMMDRTVKTAKTNATHFNREAAQKTSKQMEGFYRKNAEFHFNRALR